MAPGIPTLTPKRSNRISTADLPACPLVKGGQGRMPSDLRQDMDVVLLIACMGCVAIAIAVITWAVTGLLS